MTEEENEITWLKQSITELKKENAGLKESLRDKFAMAALTGMLANKLIEVDPSETSEPFANDASEKSYIFADGMLEARKT